MLGEIRQCVSRTVNGVYHISPEIPLNVLLISPPPSPPPPPPPEQADFLRHVLCACEERHVWQSQEDEACRTLRPMCGVPSGQGVDKEDTRKTAAATAAQLEQEAPPRAGVSVWDGARARTGRAIGGAVSAVGGMLRRASSWWRKRQREADDDGPDETRKRTKGDG